MPLFSVTEISPEIRSHRTTLEHNWNLAMNSLDAPARARYLESLRQPRDPGRELLFLYCLHCGAIQGEIFYRGTVYFFMGIPLQADRFPDIVPLRSTQGELRCELWVHRASLEIVQPIFQNEIVPLSRELLLLDTSIPGRNWIDYLQILESFLSQKALKVIKRGMPITFSHFRFHNLNHYFELLGEAGANEMIQHIEDNIKERLKSQDLSLPCPPIPISLSP